MSDVAVFVDGIKFNFRVSALIENKGRYLLEKSIRTDFLNSALKEMGKSIPTEIVDGIASGFDIKMSFLGNDVSLLALILVITLSTILLLGIYLLLSNVKLRKRIRVKNKNI